MVGVVQVAALEDNQLTLVLVVLLVSLEVTGRILAEPAMQDMVVLLVVVVPVMKMVNRKK
jgi:hypothetical protein